MTEETLYLRGKMAERGTSKAKFSQDGFDFWAETEAPARAGQVEKVPAESTKPTMEGDALKRLYARHQARQRRRGGGSVGGAMCGCEELEGGYISSWVPIIGGYPTSLSEFKEWAPRNKDKVAKFVELAKNNSTFKKYVPTSVVAMAEDFARSQGYLEGGWADGSPEYNEVYNYLISKKAGPTTARKIALEHDLTLKQIEDKMKPRSQRGSGSKARKPSARNMIVKKVMAEHGLSLPQASKYVKEHGLY